MIIKKGTPCFVSTTGHNNFYYPMYSEEGVTYFEEDVTEYKIKSWVCGRNDLTAVVVNPSSIKDLYGSNKTVVWVEKKHLKDT